MGTTKLRAKSSDVDVRYTYEERLEHGERREDLVKQYCEERGATCKKVTDLFGDEWTPNIGQLEGDLWLKTIDGNMIKMDVKMNYVSKLSLERFTGDVFVVFNSSMDSMVIPSKFLKGLEINAGTWVPLPMSGDPGLSYEQLKRICKDCLNFGQWFAENPNIPKR